MTAQERDDKRKAFQKALMNAIEGGFLNEDTEGNLALCLVNVMHQQNWAEKRGGAARAGK